MKSSSFLFFASYSFSGIGGTIAAFTIPKHTHVVQVIVRSRKVDTPKTHHEKINISTTNETEEFSSSESSKIISDWTLLFEYSWLLHSLMSKLTIDAGSYVEYSIWTCLVFCLLCDIQ
jgi:hypothetical protein